MWGSSGRPAPSGCPRHQHHRRLAMGDAMAVALIETEVPGADYYKLLPAAPWVSAREKVRDVMIIGERIPGLQGHPCSAAIEVLDEKNMLRLVTNKKHRSWDPDGRRRSPPHRKGRTLQVHRRIHDPNPAPSGGHHRGDHEAMQAAGITTLGWST